MLGHVSLQLPILLRDKLLFTLSGAIQISIKKIAFSKLNVLVIITKPGSGIHHNRHYEGKGRGGGYFYLIMWKKLNLT